jgi:CheY-like chemotaxis protein
MSTIGRARRVLVLDDDDGSRAITKYVLEEAGHVCEVVVSALAALAAIVTFAPDVVLYEWDLRGDAGIGLAARLRAASAGLGRALVVIAVSVLDETPAFRAREASTTTTRSPWTSARSRGSSARSNYVQVRLRSLAVRITGRLAGMYPDDGAANEFTERAATSCGTAGSAGDPARLAW